MRFMTLWRPAKTSNAGTPEMSAQMEKLIGEMNAKGVMILTGGWSPQTPCKTLVAKDGEIRTIDGPYAEAKEMIGGFAVLECASEEECIAWGKKFLAIAGDGTSELRKLGF